MSADQRPSRGRVIAVAGEAGSGKTTLGRALAAELKRALLDLDSITNPVLDSIPVERLGNHWLASADRVAIRAGRYAAMRAVLADVVAGAGDAVLVAPFTAELRGEEDYDALARASAPARLEFVYLRADAELLAQRRGVRGEARDGHRLAAERTAPSIPVLEVDAALPTARQVQVVLNRLGD